MKNYFSKIFLVSIGVLVVSIFLLPLFVFAQAAPGQIVPCSGWLECDFCQFSQMVSNLMNYALFAVALPVGVVVIIIAGVMFVTAGGNPSKVDSAKKALLYAVIGLVVAFGAWLIVDATLGALVSPGYKVWHEFPNCSGGVDIGPPDEEPPPEEPPPEEPPEECIPEDCPNVCFSWSGESCSCEYDEDLPSCGD